MKALSIKTLFAAGGLALGLAAAPAAQAGVSVDIGVGIHPPVTAGWNGGYGVYGGYGGYLGGYDPDDDGDYGVDHGYDGPGYGHRPVYDGYVTCRDGRRILWRRGYSGIEVQSCRRGVYRYTAWRNGKQYLMAVDAGGGVTRLRRIYD
ncbi:MAG: hypothetical protein IOC82_12705 [Aestuariivirga sp.]|uniref:hypothetical protein n=1 Tax=Aestuariivirga sp. TaxID=2650926 RepID=UPI0025C67E69|nr:hypothetical protein [Aestuariivirga sp.]MCA3561878.1 hypothetical protein [Aestuariivirga sp.]